MKNDNAAPLMELKDVKTYFKVPGGTLKAVNGVSPEPGGNPLLALLFVDGEETGRLLFFHPDDLTLVY